MGGEIDGDRSLTESYLHEEPRAWVYPHLCRKHFSAVLSDHTGWDLDVSLF